MFLLELILIDLIITKNILFKLTQYAYQFLDKCNRCVVFLDNVSLIISYSLEISHTTLISNYFLFPIQPNQPNLDDHLYINIRRHFLTYFRVFPNAGGHNESNEFQVFTIWAEALSDSRILPVLKFSLNQRLASPIISILLVFRLDNYNLTSTSLASAIDFQRARARVQAQVIRLTEFEFSLELEIIFEFGLESRTQIIHYP